MILIMIILMMLLILPILIYNTPDVPAYSYPSDNSVRDAARFVFVAHSGVPLPMDRLLKYSTKQRPHKLKRV